MADKILNSFDVWIAAQGWKSKLRLRGVDNISLEGIDRLRDLILELAVRGKLVPQDLSDEPSQKLLERISEEKRTLLKEGKIKKLEPVIKVSSEECTYSIPNNWSWVRLSDYYDVRDGTHDSPKSQTSGFPLVTSKNLSKGSLDLSNVTYISTEDHLKVIARSKVDEGDVLFAMIGSIGNPVIVDTQVEFSIKNVALFKYFNKELCSPNYLKIFLKVASIEMKANASGGVQSFVSLGKLRSYPMALPPLAEQHRIVNKVNELMALCDELEQQETNHLKLHQLLVETLLGTLTQSKDAAEFQTAWATLAQYFDDLFITEDSIDQLKQTILQLAVMGKLVKQDPKDEPASVLLERIAIEKERLVEEGEINKQKAMPEIGEAETPFTIPNSWSWTRLGNTGISSTGKTPSTGNSNFFGGEIPFIGPGQISNQGEILEAEKTLTEEGIEYSTVADQGDILMVCIGGSIGKTAIVKTKLTFNQQINCIRPILIHSSYLNSVMNSTHFHHELLEKATGSATPIINRGKWEELLVSIPPLAEQHRIVSKVDELFVLCDRMKERITVAQKISNDLANSVLNLVV